MQNIAPSRSLTRRSRDLLFAAFLVILLGILLIVVGAAMFVVNFVVPSNPGYDLYAFVRSLLMYGGGLIVVVGVALIVRALTWKTDNQLAEQVGEELAQYVDKRFVFIRNINKISLGYVDAVLIGPPGILVFRISDKKGVLFNDGGFWLRQKEQGEWKTLKWNPTKEAVDDIQKLRDYLAIRGKTDIPVFGVVVFTKEPPETQFSTQNPVVPVIYLSEISYNLSDSYFAKDRISQQTATELADLLYNK